MSIRFRPRVVVLASGGVLLLAGALWTLRLGEDRPSPSTTAGLASSDISLLAFRDSYLNAANGRPAHRRTQCRTCHPPTPETSARESSVLESRAAMSREAWASEILLPVKCGACHVVPDPSNLPRQSWPEVMSRMDRIMDIRGVPRFSDHEFQDILHFYLSFSPEAQPPLGPDADAGASPLIFAPIVLGNPAGADSRDRPFLGHVHITDLDQDGRLDVLVSDTARSEVTWIREWNGVWTEQAIATVRFPVHTQVLPQSDGNHLDIVVGSLGASGPTDDLVGSVVLLTNNGAMQFTPVVLRDRLGRVADVERADVDGDGTADFVVAAYGHLQQGEVGWLRRQPDQTYQYHLIAKRTGAIHALPTELNGDGRLDLVVLFAQEHEEISAFLQDPTGAFQERGIFKAATPAFGSSGIQLVDLDRDGDVDILHTNGDNLDLPSVIPRPFHGVQWLENTGNLNFTWHHIHRAYGAYCAVVGDLDSDDDLDIVATTLFNDWSDPKRASLFWLENDGRQQFTPHSIAFQPTHLISAALGDLDRDGRLDIVTCGMYGFPPFDRMARVTLWKNLGARK